MKLRKILAPCRVLLAAAIAAAAAAAPLPAQGANVTGTWTVTFGGTDRMTLVLQQSGTNVTGTLHATDNSRGDVTGTFDGTTLVLTRDTGLETIQRYRVTVSGDRFSGSYVNEGKYAASGTFDGVRGTGTTVAPPPPPSNPPPSTGPTSQGDIGLNGCWNQCSVHILHDQDGTLYFSASWQNSFSCKDCLVLGWYVQQGKGRISGQDVHLGGVSAPNLLRDRAGNPLTQGTTEYVFKLSADGNRLVGYFSINGQRGGDITWVRDK